MGVVDPAIGMTFAPRTTPEAFGLTYSAEAAANSGGKLKLVEHMLPNQPMSLAGHWLVAEGYCRYLQSLLTKNSNQQQSIDILLSTYNNLRGESPESEVKFQLLANGLVPLR